MFTSNLYRDRDHHVISVVELVRKCDLVEIVQCALKIDNFIKTSKLDVSKELYIYIYIYISGWPESSCAFRPLSKSFISQARITINRYNIHHH